MEWGGEKEIKKILSSMDTVQGKCSRLMKKGKERLEKDYGKSKENSPSLISECWEAMRKDFIKKDPKEEWAESRRLERLEKIQEKKCQK